MNRAGIVNTEGHAVLDVNGMRGHPSNFLLSEKNGLSDKMCSNYMKGGESREVMDLQRENRNADVVEKPNKSSARQKVAQTPVFIGMSLKQWIITGRIGAGSFGETFAAVESAGREEFEDRQSDSSRESMAISYGTLNPCGKQEVCIKVEQENKNVLRVEAAALKRVQPCPQVVRYLGSGSTRGLNFLVMQRLGPNLAELRRNTPSSTFSVFTMLKVGISCLKAIRGVHELGLVHRDIKPSNFVIGSGDGTSDPRTCYLIDFGLARRYCRPNGEVRQPRENAGFRGTSRYASLASHHHQELGRVDDLWSLLFMLIEFVTGTLPWRTYKEKEEIGRCKEEVIGPGLVQKLPREFRPFLAHLQTLQYEDEPRYDFLLSLMERAIERRGYPPNKKLDWEPDEVREAEAEDEEEEEAEGGGKPPCEIDSHDCTKYGENRLVDASPSKLMLVGCGLPAPFELPAVPAPETVAIATNRGDSALFLMPPSRSEEIMCRVGLSDVKIFDENVRHDVSRRDPREWMATSSQIVTTHTALNHAGRHIFTEENPGNENGKGSSHVNGLGGQGSKGSSENVEVGLVFSPREDDRKSASKNCLGCGELFEQPATSNNNAVVVRDTSGSTLPQSPGQLLPEEQKQKEEHQVGTKQRKTSVVENMNTTVEYSPSQPKSTPTPERKKHVFSCECTII